MNSNSFFKIGIILGLVFVFSAKAQNSTQTVIADSSQFLMSSPPLTKLTLKQEMKNRMKVRCQIDAYGKDVDGVVTKWKEMEIKSSNYRLQLQSEYFYVDIKISDPEGNKCGSNAWLDSMIQTNFQFRGRFTQATGVSTVSKVSVFLDPNETIRSDDSAPNMVQQISTMTFAKDTKVILDEDENDGPILSIDIEKAILTCDIQFPKYTELTNWFDNF